MLNNGKPGQVLKITKDGECWVDPITQDMVFNYLDSVRYYVEISEINDVYKDDLIRKISDIKQYILDTEKKPPFDKFDVYG